MQRFLIPGTKQTNGQKRQIHPPEDDSRAQVISMQKKLRTSPPMELSLERDEEFFDVKIVVGEKEVHAHKWVLIQKSLYFEKMLRSPMMEGRFSVVKLDDFDDFDAVQTVVTYMYTSSIELTAENVITYMYIADFMQIDQLKSKCSEVMAANVNACNALSYFKSVKQLSVDESVETIGKFITANFTESVVENPAFLDLNYSDACELLSLKGKNESEALQHTLTWVNHNKLERKGHLYEMLNKLNWEKVGIYQLLNALDDTIVKAASKSHTLILSKYKMNSFAIAVEDCRSKMELWFKEKKTEGQELYILSKSWYDEFTSAPLLSGQRIKPVDNADLFQSPNTADDVGVSTKNIKREQFQLRCEIKENEDFLLVPEEAWQCLIERVGCKRHHAIKRKISQTSDTQYRVVHHPIYVNCSCNPHGSGGIEIKKLLFDEEMSLNDAATKIIYCFGSTMSDIKMIHTNEGTTTVIRGNYQPPRKDFIFNESLLLDSAGFGGSSSPCMEDTLKRSHITMESVLCVAEVKTVTK